jgi:hypothetical protein
MTFFSSPFAVPFGHSSCYHDVFRVGHGCSLRAWLADEEACYAVGIKKRLELIKSGVTTLSTREYRLRAQALSPPLREIDVLLSVQSPSGIQDMDDFTPYVRCLCLYIRCS